MSIDNIKQHLFASLDLLEKLQPDKDEIQIIWHIDDVSNVRKDLTLEQCREVLQYVKRHHDANNGVTWDTLRITADEMYP